MRSRALSGIFTSGRRPRGFSSTLLKVPIELFTSLESDTDPLHHQRKRGAAKEPHVKKKSRTEEKPP